MPLVGDGNIAIDFKKISKELAPEKRMEECLKRILRPFNPSITLIDQKVKNLLGIRTRSNYDIMKELTGQYDAAYVSSEEAEQAEEAGIEHLRKKYIMVNMMNLISRMPNKNYKVICLVFLATEAQLLVRNPDDFKLLEDFPTDNQYILFDNKSINKVIREIYEDTKTLASQLDQIKTEFKANVDEEVSDIIFSYTNEQFLKMSTSDFFKAVKRAIGTERYNCEVQRYISEFLRKYKKAVKSKMRGNAKEYCKKFGVDPVLYTQENILKAMKPIDELNIWT